jgi:hypothetical protein
MEPSEFNAAVELERYKAQLNLHLEHQKAIWAGSQTMFRLLGDFGLLTIKSLILANGAAMVALLTFLGNLWSRQGDAQSRALTMRWPLMTFGLGLAFALLAAAAS